MKNDSTNIYEILKNKLGYEIFFKTIGKYRDLHDTEEEIIAFFEYNAHNYYFQRVNKESKNELEFIDLDNQKRIRVYYDEETKIIYFIPDENSSLTNSNTYFAISDSSIKCIKVAENGIFIERFSPRFKALAIEYYDKQAKYYLIGKGICANDLLEDPNICEQAGIKPDLKISVDSIIDKDYSEAYKISVIRNNETIDKEIVGTKELDKESIKYNKRTIYSLCYEFMKKRGYYTDSLEEIARIKR